LNVWWDSGTPAGALAAFLVTLVLMPPGIEWLRRLNFGQNVREDGPEAHRSKAGTPTMGGVLFIPPGAAAAVWVATRGGESPGTYALLVGVFTLGGLAIGWLDDYRSIRSGRSLGLKAREKLALQILLSALFLAGIRMLYPVLGSLPGMAVRQLYLAGWEGFVVALLACVWLMNAANIADGLDGLAAGQGIVALVSIVICASLAQPSSPALHGAPLAMAGALLAFLCFNSPPARIFMGDAGSIALGCFVAGFGLLLVPLWPLALATAVWSLEALSVVAQVVYFRLTGGRRLFRMAPVHHHFELCGWPEPHVTARFIAASVVLGILLPMALKGWLVP